MAMGRRKTERQDALFITADNLPRSQGHPFYQALNRLLAEAGFDRWIEQSAVLRAGRDPRPASIPPASTSACCWSATSRGSTPSAASPGGVPTASRWQFLGLTLEEHSPDHSTLSLTRRRLPPEVFEEVFQFVLKIAAEKKLLSGKTVGVELHHAGSGRGDEVDRPPRHGRGLEGVRHAADARGGCDRPTEEPTDEEVRRFDKRRKDKKVSNDEWVSPTDPDAKITKMKDGTTHLAYKAEHVVDLRATSSWRPRFGRRPTATHRRWSTAC